MDNAIPLSDFVVRIHGLRAQLERRGYAGAVIRLDFSTRTSTWAAVAMVPEPGGSLVYRSLGGAFDCQPPEMIERMQAIIDAMPHRWSEIDVAATLGATPHDWRGTKIVTEFVHPPIPLRQFDWAAVLDGYEPGDALGEGRTEDEAVADLIDQLDERAADREAA